jgi:hypothetical protein
MNKIYFTEEDIKLAEEMTQRVLKAEPNAKTYLPQNVLCDVIGYLGELAFKKFLDSKGVEYKWSGVQLKGGDKFDFCVEDTLLDIKTSQAYRGIALNEWQLYKASINSSILVGVYIDNYSAEILGYTTPFYFTRCPDMDFKNREMYCVPENKLFKFKNV